MGVVLWFLLYGISDALTVDSDQDSDCALEEKGHPGSAAPLPSSVAGEDPPPQKSGVKRAARKAAKAALGGAKKALGGVTDWAVRGLKRVADKVDPHWREWNACFELHVMYNTARAAAIGRDRAGRVANTELKQLFRANMADFEYYYPEFPDESRMYWHRPCASCDAWEPMTAKQWYEEYLSKWGAVKGGALIAEMRKPEVMDANAMSLVPALREALENFEAMQGGLYPAARSGATADSASEDSSAEPVASEASPAGTAGSSADPDSSAEASETPAQAFLSPEEALPAGWHAQLVAETGETYYWHDDGVVQWEPPYVADRM